MMPTDVLASLGGRLGGIDWLIVAAYFGLTTWLGHALSGKQATLRDFFLGGRKLPWYAVSASIIATEISAVTFIGAVALVFNPGGDLTYLQLGLFGSVLARLIVGYVLVPAYFRREIYSPYDFMADRLGESARTVTTVLFSVAGVMSQSARVYLTAVILRVVLHDELTAIHNAIGISPLVSAIIMIGLVALAWTLMGGIATVVWTDFVLFVVFVAGAITALCIVLGKMDIGAAEMVRRAAEAGKLQFWNFDVDLTHPFTFWAAIIAATWTGVGAYGADQMIAQRMFCCKNEKAARWAIISSSLGLGVTALVMFVGVGLFVYYSEHPLTGEALALYNQNKDTIFPIFIMQHVPAGLKGLILAGIFAAAISSLDSILAALSQTLMSAFFLPKRRKSDDTTELGGGQVRASRLLVVGCAAMLCISAVAVDVVQQYYNGILNLALALAQYALGGLVGSVALALFTRKVDGRGLIWSGPLSVMCVFAVAWHQPWTHYVCWAAGFVFVGSWCTMWMRNIWTLTGKSALDLQNAASRALVHRDRRATVYLLAGVALMLLLNHFAYADGPPATDGTPTYVVLAWPWYTPLGTIVTFTLGRLLARLKPETTTRATDTDTEYNAPA